MLYSQEVSKYQRDMGRSSKVGWLYQSYLSQLLCRKDNRNLLGTSLKLWGQRSEWHCRRNLEDRANKKTDQPRFNNFQMDIKLQLLIQQVHRNLAMEELQSRNHRSLPDKVNLQGISRLK